MEFGIAIQLAGDILRQARVSAEEARGLDFSRYAKLVAYAARQIPQQDRAPWFTEWAVAWRKLHDDFERIRLRDPMVVYRPHNKTAEAFHRSGAFIRYYRAGNRTSKTTAGYAEHYFAVTGLHPYRKMPAGQASTFIVSGLPFVDYAPRVFQKKMLTGEDDNPLSPMFPENGKWFYHYDPRKYTITIACAECAAAGKAQSCPGHHLKYTISLVSSEKGKDVIEAFSARIGHGDEHIPEDFLAAMKMRVADQRGYLLFTGTPLHGPEAWEAQELASWMDKPASLNRMDPENEKSPPYCEMFTCSMWDGNVVSHDTIRTLTQGMDEFEVRARVDGIPSPLATNPVFDRRVLSELQAQTRIPHRGILTYDKPLVEVKEGDEASFAEKVDGPLRIWELPRPDAQYLISVDTAAGLSPKARDASCASVFRFHMVNNRLRIDMVAQFHSWLTIHEYADEVFKLGVWYNSAPVVVELTGGLGRAVVERLKMDLCYWNIYRQPGKGEYAEFSQDFRFGIDTSQYNKASMIALTQQVLKDGLLGIPCKDTIAEMTAFEQERTDFGNTRYRGYGGSRDDRVMSLVIGVSTIISGGLYNAAMDLAKAAPAETRTEQAEAWKQIRKELKERQDVDAWLG